jgi:SNF2 family DNA or RNA helicase
MNFKPTEEQERMISHLLKNDIAALFCLMGKGKTVSTLTALSYLFSDMASKGALIVSPLRVNNLTWPDECAKWDHTRWMKVANLRTDEGRESLRRQDAQIYLLNYDMLQNFRKTYIDPLGKKSPPFDIVVWDELSMAKNPQGKRIRAVRAFTWKHCTRRWGLTGTPSPNSLLDLFGQILLLDKGDRLGHSMQGFKFHYFNTVDFNGYKWAPKSFAKDAIEQKISDIALVIDGEEWEIEEVDELVTLPHEALKTYKKMKDELIIEFSEGRNVTSMNAASLVTKLSQISSGAVYLSDNEHQEYQVIHDEKIKKLKELLADGQNTIVVFKFKHERDRIKQAIPDAIIFDEAICPDWNAGKIKIMLAHPKSMSHGLNLQGGGHRIIWTTPTYSREEYDQLNARLARRGQHNRVKVVRLIAKKTSDKLVYEVLKSKGDSQKALMEAVRKLNTL